uniref:ATP synthase subunit a n=1 Tax=Cavernulicola chilensis TaxID=3028028 RepID=A0A7H0WB74_9RHOD|nr:ATP synthase F0 subunit 6 [Cavernulicola chilensis]QNR39803.1 ATP synthase F0 subunit 6 [Cavernulicola chilensis]
MKSLMCSSPLEQFEIVTLMPISVAGLNLSVTNAALFLVLASLAMLQIFYLSNRSRTIVPSRWQNVTEMSYEATSTIVQDNLGERGEKYFPFVFMTFMMLLSCNLLGIVPYSYTVTSQIAFTFALSLSAFVGINLIGIRKHGFHFMAIFLPKGAPTAILPLLVIIEFISYIIKVFTLAIRLFANMTAGHTLLKIIAGFALSMLSIGGFMSLFHVAPLVILLALVGLELGIAVLQAYVFTLLVCIYLNDVIDIH